MRRYRKRITLTAAVLCLALTSCVSVPMDLTQEGNTDPPGPDETVESSSELTSEGTNESGTTREITESASVSVTESRTESGETEEKKQTEQKPPQCAEDVLSLFEPDFGMPSGIYREQAEVKLSVEIDEEDMELLKSFDPEAGEPEIRYVVNGENPCIGKVFAEPETLNCENGKDYSVYSVKAVLTSNGHFGREWEQTYIIQDSGTEDWNVNVVCLTSDWDGLYDYYKGILVPGYTYFSEYDPQMGLLSPGNYSKRDDSWIRDAHMTVFAPDGSVSAEQSVGIGVSGGSSARMNPKSLKVYAGEEYDPEFDHLYLELDNVEYDSQAYPYVDKYNSIRLRAGGQDVDFGNIRSAVVSRLAQESGFDGCTASRRCIVFLNNEFYGLADMQQNYSDSYLSRRFGLPDKDQVEKMKGYEVDLFARYGLTPLFQADLSKEENRKALEEKVDIDNYLMYYAIRVMCNWTDQVNNEIWRYTGPAEEGNPYTDGRFRFLIYDCDVTFGSDYFPDYFTGSEDDVFVQLIEDLHRAKGICFHYLMSEPVYRDRFVNLVCNLCNGPFSQDRLSKIMDEEDAKIAALRHEFYEEDFALRTEESVEETKKAALAIESRLRRDLEKYFGLSAQYELILSANEGVSISAGAGSTVYANTSRSNRYYSGAELSLTAREYPGYAFDHWEINGQEAGRDRTLAIPAAQRTGKLNVKAFCVRDPGQCLAISSVFTKGDDDKVVLTNVSGAVLDLNGFYFTDDPENLQKYVIRKMTLAPGETVTLYGEDSPECPFDEFRCPFKWKTGEVICVTDGSRVVDSVRIPEIPSAEFYQRYDNSSDWVYVR